MSGKPNGNPRGVNTRAARKVIELRKKLAKEGRLGAMESSELKRATRKTDASLREMVRDMRSRD